MPRSTKNITIRIPTRSASLRFSRPDWNKKVPLRRVLITIAVTALLFFTIRAPHGSPNVSIPYVVLMLDAMCVLCIRHMGDLEYGTDLIPFLVAAAVGLLFQRLTADGYYRFSYATSAFTLLAAMVVCAILVTQKGYSELIWSLFNGVALFSGGCILLQTVLRPLGIRLDHMGALSDWFFNAWESNTAFRPCGPFLEPAMYAQIALIGLYHALFLRRSWRRAVFLILSLIASTSALGLVGIGGLTFFLMLHSDKLYGVRTRTRNLIVAAICISMALIVFLGQYLGIYIFERALAGSSLDVRLLRSVDLYYLMSPLEKIFGIGLQNQQNYLNYYGIILDHDTWETTIGANREFASMLGYVPCTMGLIGLVTFVFPFYRVFKRGGVRSQAAVLLFFFVCLFCGMISNTIFVLYIMFVYAAYDFERMSTDGPTSGA